MDDTVVETDRLPRPATLTAAQHDAVNRFEKGPRGTLFGPFVPLLRSPELMTRLQLVGEYLRFDSTVPDHLRELTILLVARNWDQDFEWGHHAPLARAAGLDPEVIDAVARGEQPDTGHADVTAVWRLVTELIAHHTVGDATYAAALALLGDDGVVDVVGLVGYYTTLAMTLNVARTPIPEGYERVGRR